MLHFLCCQKVATPIRYVINPNNQNEVIDMKHFFVVGHQGEFVGLLFEIFQKIRGFNSAFDSQDFLSNYLGTKFYSEYNKNLSWQKNLLNFFDRKENVCHK